MPDSCGKTASKEDIAKWVFQKTKLSRILEKVLKEREKKEKHGRWSEVEKEDAYSPEKLAKACEKWISQFPSRETPQNKAHDLYEIKHTGSNNYLIEGGGEQVWADGYRTRDATVLEAKFTGNPERSPFIDDSNLPSFLKNQIRSRLENEFERYGAVINDANNPMKNLEVITNNPRSKPYFEELLKKVSHTWTSRNKGLG
ncbi:MAG: hypothetical protein F6J86_09150 [Symploca sp. SIO1B1]|nr:hypothetical protein [Symploca sp. SIO1B1]